jgi:hypothetical protein
VHKPEALTTFGRSNVKKFNLHDNRYLQPGRRWSINSGAEWSGSPAYALTSKYGSNVKEIKK